MLIINFEGREAKGLSKGRYDETFAGEDDVCKRFHLVELERGPEILLRVFIY